MKNKLYVLDENLSYAEDAMKQLESAEMFLDHLIDSIEGLGLSKEGIHVFHEILVKSKGIHSLLEKGNRELTEYLARASEISTELNAKKA